MIKRLTKKDKISFYDYCLKENKFQDLFILKDNEQKVLKDINDIKYVFGRIYKHEYLAYISEDKEVLGILLLFRNDKKWYISLKTNNLKTANHLFNIFFWNNNYKELHMIIPENNRLKYVAKTYKFRIRKRENNLLYLTYKRD